MEPKNPTALVNRMVGRTPSVTLLLSGAREGAYRTGSEGGKPRGMASPSCSSLCICISVYALVLAASLARDCFISSELLEAKRLAGTPLFDRPAPAPHRS